MREIHLFAGLGGGILASHLLGHSTVCAVEASPFRRNLLQSKQDIGIFNPFPIHDDVRTFNGAAWRGRADLVCGGFPCQPWSTAGRNRGAADERHLWPEMARIVGEVRPAYIFAENVALKAFEEPWRDLRAMGFVVPPAVCLSAADSGAPHLRKRWWLLAAHPDRCGKHARPDDAALAGLPPAGGVSATPTPTAYLDRFGLEVRKSLEGHTGEELPASEGGAWRRPEPRLHRLVSRVASRLVPNRKQRIQATGDTQVPQVAAKAFLFLMRQLEDYT